METHRNNFGSISQENILKLLRNALISESVCHEVGLIPNDSSVTGIKGEGVAYPYRNELGNIVSYRVGLAKPFPNESGKLVKYLQKSGADSYPFYVPTDRLKIFTSTGDLIVTEGEKKLLALKSKSEFNGFPVASFPGAHNWQIKDSQGLLSPSWEKIPMKGRLVFLVADTDFFYNFQVYSGYMKFIRQLYERGATIHLVDLRPSNSDGEEGKIGVDDAIEKFGAEYVLNKIQAPCWTFGIEDWSKGAEEYTKFISGLVLYSKAEQSILLDQMKAKDSRFNKGTAKLILKEAQAAWSEIRPPERLPDNAVIWNPLDESLKELFLEIGKKISKIPGLYRYSGLPTLVHIENWQPKVLSRVSQLGAFLSNHVTYRKAKKTPEGVELMGIDHIPEDHLLGLVENLENLAEVPEVNFVTSTPQVTKDKIISERGYDKSSKIYYIGDPLQISVGPSRLNYLLDSFPFETEVDKTNFLGLLVSLFFVQKYVGQHPAVIFQGDEQSLGKTELARCLAYLFQAKEAQILTWTHDEELKKAVSGSLSDNDFVIIDNVKAHRDTSVISSQAMEGLITSPMLSFRALGENRVFSRPNNAIFSFTLNKGVFSDDLVVRSVAISLSKTNKCVMKDDFKPIAYVQQHRGELLGEVAAMIDKSFGWAGSIELPGEGELGQFKFKAWAIEIQKVLLANGKTGFLSNQAVIAKKMSPIHNALENFIVQQVVGLSRSKTEFFTATDILRHLPPSVFNGDHNFASQVTLVGRALKSIKVVAYDGEVIEVQRYSSSQGGKSYRYSFSLKDIGASEL